MRLRDRVVLVWGAGSAGPADAALPGNGRAAAILYAREGAHVLCIDRDGDSAQATADRIAHEGGVAVAWTADVTRADDVAAAARAALDRWGRIDVLHNNVGTTHMAPLEDVTEADWHRVMDVNLTGAFLACRAVLPHMKRAGSGAIVNISSLAGSTVNAYPYYSYAASKAALDHLTRAIAVHYAPHGIRANAVLPGVMNTPLMHAQVAGQYASVEAMVRARDAMSPMRRMGTAWDVARAAVFLASDEASYITGACLPVDGGLSCLSG